MKLFKLTLLILLTNIFFSYNAKAIDWDFGGYVYNNLSYQSINESLTKLDTSIKAEAFINELFRIRFKPEIYFWENTRLTANYEISGMVNKIKLPFYISTEKTNRQLVDLNWNLTDQKINDNINLFTNHYIDLLYLKQFFDWGEVVLGRQIVSWGVGRIWQPSDLFNPINPVNFSKIERDGTDALSSKIYLGSFTDLQFVVNFNEVLKKNNYGVRFRTNFAGYDLSSMVGYFDENVVIGGDFAGNLFGAGVRGEAIVQHNTDSNNFTTRFILGADYQFTGDLYGLIEYQYNGFGTGNKDEYLMYFEKLIKGEIQNLSKNYLAMMLTYQLHPLVSTNLTNIWNMNDNSAMIGITINYNFLQDLNLGLGIMNFIGDTGSEYSYYPTAIYLNTEWYF